MAVKKHVGSGAAATEEEKREENEGAKKAAAFAKARMEMWEEFRDGWFPEQPHASTSLSLSSLSFVFPSNSTEFSICHYSPHTNCEQKTSESLSRHLRTAAAALLQKLIEWGTQRADERGLKSVLMASEAGLSAYLSMASR